MSVTFPNVEMWLLSNNAFPTYCLDFIFDSLTMNKSCVPEGSKEPKCCYSSGNISREVLSYLSREMFAIIIDAAISLGEVLIC